ncbi:PTS IIA-like nitrogen regulatory protein PtsN [Asticcacaulis tiandongensis]|uniref:PTS IIA-like nitrogen regulatory protein PtsN n=1 Tax=Asticcacaulis tiandongensis TaxID=2565365 RepID=UPI00112B3FF8|nr:PTS IIA-like nitrogen regulatory protein PtsN [Asticcacaulis tiandongensis]
MFLSQLLERNAVIGPIGANSKRHALQIVADLAERVLEIESDTILQGLVDREKLGSTGVGLGVAVPHAALKGLDRMRGVFVRLETPVEYDAIDDMPVDLLFALFAPEDAGTEHLRALAKVSRLLRQKDLRESLRKVETADALFALLSETAHSDAA